LVTRANAKILWDMDHTKGRLCKGGIVQGKETKYRNFKLPRTMGSGLGRNEEDQKR
jgi:hypothetical protein